VRACLFAALLIAFPGVRAADACTQAGSLAASIADLRARGVPEAEVNRVLARDAYVNDLPRLRALVAEVYRDKLTPAAAAKRVRERCLISPR